MSSHYTSEGLRVNTSRRHIFHPHQVCKRCIFCCSGCLESVSPLQPAEVRVLLCVHWTPTEPRHKVTAGGEDRGPAVEAVRRCSTLKSQPNPLSAMDISRRRRAAGRTEFSAGGESMTAPLHALIPKQWCLQRGNVLCQGAGGGQGGWAPSCPSPHRIIESQNHSITFPPNPSHLSSLLSPAVIKCLDTLVPPSCHFSACERQQESFPDLTKHVSHCLHSDVTATEAREQTTYSAFRYRAPVCKAGIEHGSYCVPFSFFSLLATCSLFL